MIFVSTYKNTLCLELTETEVDELEKNINLEEMDIHLFEGVNQMTVQGWEDIRAAIQKLTYKNHTLFELESGLTEVLSDYEKAKQNEQPPKWQMELEKIQQCPKREDSLENQLADLYIIAVRFGLEAPGELLKSFLVKKERPSAVGELVKAGMKSYPEIIEEIALTEKTLENYRKAFQSGEISQGTLKSALNEYSSTIGTLKWVIGENDRFG